MQVHAQASGTVRLALTSENGTMYMPRAAVVHNPTPWLDEAVKKMVACAGATSCRIERVLTSAATAGVVAEPPQEPPGPGTVVALPLRYDSDLLSVLFPDAEVLIGSLMMLCPSWRWAEDGGGNVVQFADVRSVPKPPLAPWVPGFVKARPRAQGPITVRMERVPSQYGDGIARASSRVHAVNGAALRDGDVVEDAAGTKWYYRGRVLRDHVLVSVRGLDMRVDGERMTPRRLSAPPDGFISGAATELVVMWPDGDDRTTFKAVAEGAGGRWAFRLSLPKATVEHGMGTCQKDGARLAHSDPVQCVNAGGVWDRPCESDAECPYFDARRDVGGCVAGTCQLPPGATRGSFRSAADASGVTRMGCDPSDPEYPWCKGSSDADARF